MNKDKKVKRLAFMNKNYIFIMLSVFFMLFTIPTFANTTITLDNGKTIILPKGFEKNPKENPPYYALLDYNDKSYAFLTCLTSLQPFNHKILKQDNLNSMAQGSLFAYKMQKGRSNFSSSIRRTKSDYPVITIKFNEKTDDGEDTIIVNNVYCENKVYMITYRFTSNKYAPFNAMIERQIMNF